MADAARKAGKFDTEDLIDTSGLRDRVKIVVGSIRALMPKPEAG